MTANPEIAARLQGFADSWAIAATVNDCRADVVGLAYELEDGASPATIDPDYAGDEPPWSTVVEDRYGMTWRRFPAGWAPAGLMAPDFAQWLTVRRVGPLTVLRWGAA